MSFTYLSLGAGVQSTALLILSATGRCEKAEVAIFADTGDEPAWVYEHLTKLEAWSPIPIERVSRGCISGSLCRGMRRSVRRMTASLKGASDGTTRVL